MHWSRTVCAILTCVAPNRIVAGNDSMPARSIAIVLGALTPHGPPRIGVRLPGRFSSLMRSAGYNNCSGVRRVDEVSQLWGRAVGGPELRTLRPVCAAARSIWQAEPVGQIRQGARTARYPHLEIQSHRPRRPHKGEAASAGTDQDEH